MHFVISGEVQGVGFRSAVKNSAQQYGIRGYVRNLDDGRVEICAQGAADAIESFFKAVSLRPGLGSINRVDKKKREIKERYATFEIRY